MSIEERKLGADAIEEGLIRVFSMSGKTIEEFKWIPELSSEFSSFSHHTVKVTSGNSLYILENIPREVLEDYPERRGNEVINFYISKLVSVPHIDLKKVHNGNFIL